MLIKVHRVFGGYYFDDEQVAFEPDSDYTPRPTDPPNCRFVMEVAGATRFRDNAWIERLAFVEPLGQDKYVTHNATAGELVMCAIAGSHGVKLVESIVMGAGTQARRDEGTKGDPT